MVTENKPFKIYVIWAASATEHFVDEFPEDNQKEAEEFIEDIREKEKKDKECKIEKIIFGREMDVIITLK